MVSLFVIYLFIFLWLFITIVARLQELGMIFNGEGIFFIIICELLM
jgi:hypothetical protein